MADENKIRGAIRLASSVASTTNAVRTFKTAREEKDSLSLVNAIASVVVAITAILLAVRNLRKAAK